MARPSSDREPPRRGKRWHRPNGPMRALVCAGLVTAATLAGSARQPSGLTSPIAQRAAERVRALQQEADALASEERLLLVQLRQFEVERQLRNEELKEIARERSLTEQAIAGARSSAEALQQRAAAERPEIESRLVRVYKLGRAGMWRLLLDVDDWRSAARAYRTAAALARIDRDRVTEHDRTLATLGRERSELHERLTQLATLERRALAARAAADKSLANRAALVSSIDARRDLNAQLTGELELAQQRLGASVGQLDAPGRPPVLPLRAFRGALPWPARGRVLSRFGQGFGGNGRPAIRTGIEIALLEGQTVRAVHEGTVAFAGPFSGYGTLVIVDHGERTHSLYGHLSSSSVSRGDRIEAQTPVGASGLDPGGTPALYFELRVDGKPVDPVQWLTREQPAQRPQ